MLDRRLLLVSGKGYYVQAPDGSLTVQDKTVTPLSTLTPGTQKTTIMSGDTPVTAYLYGTPIITGYVDKDGLPAAPGAMPARIRLARPPGQCQFTAQLCHFIRKRFAFLQQSRHATLQIGHRCFQRACQP